MPTIVRSIYFFVADLENISDVKPTIIIHRTSFFAIKQDLTFNKQAVTVSS